MGFLASRASRTNSSFAAAAARLGIDEFLDAEGYLGWYRVLNHGYPFLDYAKAETLATDSDLMKGYAAADPAPPPETPREGERRKLIGGHFETRSTVPQRANESLVAGWLRIAAGITGVRQLSHSQAHFRTSPSGGARHPTDIGVCLGGDWADTLSGAWWYAPMSHELVRADTTIPKLVFESALQASPTAIFTIASHVRRAMWRYRDARAFRPVIIDAGHIVETLLSVIAYTGWVGRWYHAPGFVEADGDLDPVFGYVVATPGSIPVAFTDRPSAATSEARPTALRTNPLISLRVEEKGVIGENHLRRSTELLLSSRMVNALAYATPSSRQDRPTRSSDFAKIGLSPRELSDLSDAGFLLAEAEGDNLWARTRVWSEHDWYLSLLTHLGERTAPPAMPTIERRAAEDPLSSLPRALDLRRTARALTDKPLPATAVAALMKDLPSNLGAARIVLSTRHKFGPLDPGTYAWQEDRFHLVTAELPAERDITAAAIGQPWVQQFGCIVWIIPAPRPEPGSWVGAFIECGRIAQSLCLATCADPCIGVFQSPALIDENLSELLGTEASIDGAYLLGIGIVDPVVSAREKQEQSLFRPSMIFEDVA